MNEFVRGRIVQQPRALALQLAVGVACVAVAAGLRAMLAPVLGLALPYVTFFPLIAIAAVAGGFRSGLVCLIGSAIMASVAFVPPVGGLPTTLRDWVGVATFVIAGGLVLWLCEMLAASVRELASAHRQESLLVLELQHRVKNTLSVVQALAVQTFAAVGDFDGFKVAFNDRLVALGLAHNLLSEAAWQHVTVETLVRRTVEPFLGPDGRRLRMDGPELPLRSDLVVDLALCFHELATNATKHGALSTPGGRIEVRWQGLPGERARLEWRERHGPTVEPPSRRGFGSRLLERGVSRRARPNVKTSYSPGGLAWAVEFDVA